MKKKLAIFFSVIYLASFSSFLLPTVVPDEPQTVPFQSKSKHPAK